MNGSVGAVITLLLNAFEQSVILRVSYVICKASIQDPVAEWYRHWSRKSEILGSIPEWAHFSFSLYYSSTAKQLYIQIDILNMRLSWKKVLGTVGHIVL